MSIPPIRIIEKSDFVACKSCRLGLMSPTRVNQFTGGLRTLGWFLFVPGLLGVVIGIPLLSTCVLTGMKSHHNHMRKSYRRDMEEKGVPPAIIDKVMNYEELTLEELETIPDFDARFAAASHGYALRGPNDLGISVITPYVAVFFGLSCVVCGGGAMLIRKKKVLECARCGATALPN